MPEQDICNYCKINLNPNDIKVEMEGKFYHRECYGTVTCLKGIMEWTKYHPEYFHPDFPTVTKETTLEELMELNKKKGGRKY